MCASEEISTRAARVQIEWRNLRVRMRARRLRVAARALFTLKRAASALEWHHDAIKQHTTANIVVVASGRLTLRVRLFERRARARHFE